MEEYEIHDVNDNYVTTLPLGSWPKQGLAKVRAKNEAWESHFMLPKVYESVRERTPTLPSELPIWELDKQWNPESSEGGYKGQNSLDWRGHYIIGKFLERKCLKWVCMIHLSI
jgi:hypothetical protein